MVTFEHIEDKALTEIQALGLGARKSVPAILAVPASHATKRAWNASRNSQNSRDIGNRAYDQIIEWAAQYQRIKLQTDNELLAHR